MPMASSKLPPIQHTRGLRWHLVVLPPHPGTRTGWRDGGTWRLLLAAIVRRWPNPQDETAQLRLEIITTAMEKKVGGARGRG